MGPRFPILELSKPNPKVQFPQICKSHVVDSRWGKDEGLNPGLMDGCGCNQTRFQSLFALTPAPILRGGGP